jgi:hypothetical protein
VVRHEGRHCISIQKTHARNSTQRIRMHTVPECAACYRITITSCHMIGLSISQKEKKVKTTENMNPSRKSYWNNEMHFGKTNGTMPQVHSGYFCCSTIAIFQQWDVFSQCIHSSGGGDAEERGSIVEVRSTIASERMTMNGTLCWCHDVPALR